MLPEHFRQNQRRTIVYVSRGIWGRPSPNRTGPYPLLRIIFGRLGIGPQLVETRRRDDVVISVNRRCPSRRPRASTASSTPLSAPTTETPNRTGGHYFGLRFVTGKNPAEPQWVTSKRQIAFNADQMHCTATDPFTVTSKLQLEGSMDVAEAATASVAHGSAPGLTLITSRGWCSAREQCADCFVPA